MADRHIGGQMGQVLFVDLSANRIWIEEPDASIYEDFLGGYGFGARVTYSHQKAGVDPLGPDALLGFNTGVLVGSPAITPNRWTLTGKSPLTGGWGDANCGGYFGPMLKGAGFDSLFVLGMAQTPVYLWIDDGRCEILPAGDLWGMDALACEEVLRTRHHKAQVAVIGPAGEMLSLMSGVVTDYGRLAARSGLGAVMGSKRLKAVVVRGGRPYPAANPGLAAEIRRKYLREMAQNPRVKRFMKYGTPGNTAPSAYSGDSPVRNWAGVGTEEFPDANAISDDGILSLKTRNYACWKCNIACGAHYHTGDTAYPVQSVHQAEYETAAFFGTNILNNNIHSILKANDLCNRYGLDTMSTGATIGFAFDCYNQGILTRADTDGLELTWGNHSAMIRLLEKICRREGIGDLLADGTMRAAQRIGRGSEQIAVHVGGQEPSAHDARFAPSWGLIYAADATPGRHTQWAAYILETGSIVPGLDLPAIDKFTSVGKGDINAYINNLGQALFSSSICLFAMSRVNFSQWLEMLTAVTGRDHTVDDLVTAGARIAAMRMAFTVREGILPMRYHIPSRAYGVPPMERGPLKGVTVAVDAMRQEFYAARGWDPETGIPTRQSLLRLGLTDVADDLHGGSAPK